MRVYLSSSLQSTLVRYRGIGEGGFCLYSETERGKEKEREPLKWLRECINQMTSNCNQTAPISLQYMCTYLLISKQHVISTQGVQNEEQSSHQWREEHEQKVSFWKRTDLEISWIKKLQGGKKSVVQEFVTAVPTMTTAKWHLQLRKQELKRSWD